MDETRGVTHIEPLSGSCDGTLSGRAEGVERPNLEDFEGIYRRYSRRVYSLCLRMTGDEAEAQDLTQEAFLQMFRKLDTFRGDSAFYTWFYRLAVNVVLMQMRRKRRRMETSLDGTLESENPAAVDLPKSSAVSAIDGVALRDALDRLPAGFRSVVLLHDVEGYGHGQISKIMDCSVGTSKSQLHRARVRLRDLLSNNSNRPVPPKRLPAKQTRPRMSPIFTDALVPAGAM